MGIEKPQENSVELKILRSKYKVQMDSSRCPSVDMKFKGNMSYQKVENNNRISAYNSA